MSDPLEELIRMGSAPHVRRNVTQPPAPAEPQEQYHQRVERENRIKVGDLANRGTPAYVDPYGQVKAVTGPSGQPLQRYDERHGIAFEGQTPHQVNFAPEGGATLSDPFEGLPEQTDEETGLIYKEHPGVPARRITGINKDVARDRMIEEEHKQLKEISSALGRQLTVGEKIERQAFKEQEKLWEAISDRAIELQEPPESRDEALKQIDRIYSRRMKTGEANKTTGWFGSGSLTGGAELERERLAAERKEVEEAAGAWYDRRDQAEELEETNRTLLQAQWEVQKRMMSLRAQWADTRPDDTAGMPMTPARRQKIDDQYGPDLADDVAEEEKAFTAQHGIGGSAHAAQKPDEPYEPKYPKTHITRQPDGSRDLDGRVAETAAEGRAKSAGKSKMDAVIESVDAAAEQGIDKINGVPVPEVKKAAQAEKGRRELEPPPVKKEKLFADQELAKRLEKAAKQLIDTSFTGEKRKALLESLNKEERQKVNARRRALLTQEMFHMEQKEGAPEGKAGNVWNLIVNRAPQGILRGFQGMAGAMARALENQGIDPLYLDDYVDDVELLTGWIRSANPVDPDFENSLGGQILAGFAEIPGQLAPMVNPYFGALHAVGGMYQEQYADARLAGAGEDEAHATGLKVAPAGLLDFAMNKLILGRALKPLVGKVSVGTVMKAARKGLLANAALGGATEGVQTAWQNLENRLFSQFDPDRSLDEGVIASIVVGALVDSGATAALSVPQTIDTGRRYERNLKEWQEGKPESLEAAAAVRAGITEESEFQELATDIAEARQAKKRKRKAAVEEVERRHFKTPDYDPETLAGMDFDPAAGRMNVGGLDSDAVLGAKYGRIIEAMEKEGINQEERRKMSAFADIIREEIGRRRIAETRSPVEHFIRDGRIEIHENGERVASAPVDEKGVPTGDIEPEEGVAISPEVDDYWAKLTGKPPEKATPEKAASFVGSAAEKIRATLNRLGVSVEEAADARSREEEQELAALRGKDGLNEPERARMAELAGRAPYMPGGFAMRGGTIFFNSQNLSEQLENLPARHRQAYVEKLLAHELIHAAGEKAGVDFARVGRSLRNAKTGRKIDGRDETVADLVSRLYAPGRKDGLNDHELGGEAVRMVIEARMSGQTSEDFMTLARAVRVNPTFMEALRKWLAQLKSIASQLPSSGAVSDELRKAVESTESLLAEAEETGEYKPPTEPQQPEAAAAREEPTGDERYKPPPTPKPETAQPEEEPAPPPEPVETQEGIPQASTEESEGEVAPEPFDIELASGQKITIQAPSDNVTETLESHTDVPAGARLEVVPIDSLSGVTFREGRIQPLMQEMSSDNGYIERLIVDAGGTVIEGQHRLEALKRLGARKAPVVRIFGADDLISDIDSVKAALESAGLGRREHQNQMLSSIGEILMDERGDVSALKDYEAPSGYEAAWNAAIQTIINKRPTELPAASAQGEAVPGTRLVSTAVRQGETTEDGEGFQGHGDIKQAAARRGVDVTEGRHGFKDDKGNFLDRVEAAKLALESGLINQVKYDEIMSRKEPGLQSEDVRDVQAERPAEVTEQIERDTPLVSDETVEEDEANRDRDRDGRPETAGGQDRREQDRPSPQIRVPLGKPKGDRPEEDRAAPELPAELAPEELARAAAQDPVESVQRVEVEAGAEQIPATPMLVDTRLVWNDPDVKNVLPPDAVAVVEERRDEAGNFRYVAVNGRREGFHSVLPDDMLSRYGVDPQLVVGFESQGGQPTLVFSLDAPLSDRQRKDLARAQQRPKEAQPDGTVASGKPNGVKARFRWRAIEASELEAMIQKEVNESQTRQRKNNRASQEQIEQIAANPDPDFLLESRSAIYGAPVVDANEVIAGNGRSLGLIEAHKRATVARQYLPALKKFAARHDVNIEGMSRPIMIREALGFEGGEATRDRFVVESNPNRIGLVESPSEAALLDAEALGRLLEEEESIQFTTGGDLTEPSLRKVGAALDQAQRGVQQEQDGTFNKREASERTLAAALALLFKRSGGNIEDVTSVLETEDAKRAVSAVVAKASELARMPGDLSIGRDIIDALVELKSGLKSGMPIEEWYQNRGQELIGAELSTGANILLGHMITSTSRRSNKELREFLDSYIDLAKIEAQHRREEDQSISMFGARKEQPAESLLWKASEEQEQALLAGAIPEEIAQEWWKLHRKENKTPEDHDRIEWIEKKSGQKFWVEPSETIRVQKGLPEKLPPTPANRSDAVQQQFLIDAQDQSGQMTLFNAPVFASDMPVAPKTLPADKLRQGRLIEWGGRLREISGAIRLWSPHLLRIEFTDGTNGVLGRAARVRTWPRSKLPEEFDRWMPPAPEGQPVLRASQIDLFTDAEIEQKDKPKQKVRPGSYRLQSGGEQSAFDFKPARKRRNFNPAIVTARRNLMPSPPDHAARQSGGLRAVLDDTNKINRHQRFGFNMMMEALGGKGAGLLADGTGTGKTRQEIIIAHARAQNAGPAWVNDNGVQRFGEAVIEPFQQRQVRLLAQSQDAIAQEAHGRNWKQLSAEQKAALEPKRADARQQIRTQMRREGVQFDSNIALGVELRVPVSEMNVDETRLRERGFEIADGVASRQFESERAARVAARDLFAPGKAPVLIVTENAQIINDAFASDAAVLGIPVWRYGGDAPVPGRVYVATYDDLRREIVDPEAGWDTVIFDEAHNLKNLIGGSAKATAAKRISDYVNAVLYATATPIDKLMHAAYLEPLFERNIREVWDEIGVEVDFMSGKEGAQPIERFREGVTDEEIERRVESLFADLTRKGLMIKREVPLNNLDVKFREVEITPEQYTNLDSIYWGAWSEMDVPGKRVFREGRAGMVSRAYLENAKVEAALEEAIAGVENGKQVIVYADRVNPSNDRLLGGLDSTMDQLRRGLEKRFGKGSVGTIYGADGKKIAASIVSFQNGDIKVALATSKSGGTGINLDDIYGDAPRKLIMMTPPWSALDFVQISGRINRLTTASRGEVVALFADHFIDTWNLDIVHRKLRGLSAAITGDWTEVHAVKDRTQEITTRDEAEYLSNFTEMNVKEALAALSGEQASEWRKKIESEKRKQEKNRLSRLNKNTISEDQLMELANDPMEFGKLSEGHRRFQEHIARMMAGGVLRNEHAVLLRSVFAQSKGKRILKALNVEIEDIQSLGRGGGTFGGPGEIIMQRNQLDRPQGVTRDPARVFLHEYGHVGYFTMLSPTERKLVNRVYARLGGRSGANERFLSAVPEEEQKRAGSRYSSKNVFEFFAESFAEYVLEKRTPHGALAGLFASILKPLKRAIQLMRGRAEEIELHGLFDRILDLREDALGIDYSAPERLSQPEPQENANEWIDRIAGESGVGVEDARDRASLFANTLRNADLMEVTEAVEGFDDIYELPTRNRFHRTLGYLLHHFRRRGMDGPPVPFLYRVLRDFGVSENDIDDVASITMQKLVENPQSFREGGMSEFKSFLATTAKNSARNFWRDRSRRPQSDEEFNEETTEERIPEIDLSVFDDIGALKRAIGALNDIEKYVIQQMFVLDRSTRDIAPEVGRSHVYVAQVAKDALKKLHGVITGNEYLSFAGLVPKEFFDPQAAEAARDAQVPLEKPVAAQKPAKPAPAEAPTSEQMLLFAGEITPDVKFLMRDAPPQTVFLSAKAKEAGFDNLTRFAVEKPAEFRKHAMEWRERHPVSDVDASALRAADPSEFQAAAGNYRKGHVRIGGLEVSIEKPAFSLREGPGWKQILHTHYGYIRGTTGNDGDHLDVMIKPGTQSDFRGVVYVVNQINPDTGAFDEHKAVVGANSPEEARALYLLNYEPGWKGFGSISPMTFERFKRWARSRRARKEAPPAPPESQRFLTGDPPAIMPVQTPDDIQTGDRIYDSLARKNAVVTRETPAHYVVRYEDGQDGKTPKEQAHSTPMNFSLETSDLFAAPMPKLSAKEEAALDKNIGSLEKTMLQSLRDWWKETKGTISKHIGSGVFSTGDPILRAEKQLRGGKLASAEKSPWKSYMMTRNLPSVIQYLLEHGQLEYRDGWFQPKEGPGLVQIIRSIATNKKKAKAWEGYMAALRAEELMAQGREHLFTDDEIKTLKALDQKFPEFKKAAEAYRDFNRMLLDLAEASGLITAEGRLQWESEVYVPFFRLLDPEGEVLAPKKRRGIANQRSPVRRLFGGESKIPVLENIYKNMETIVDASFKNAAMRKIVSVVGPDALEPVKYKPVSTQVALDEIRAALARDGIDMNIIPEDKWEHAISIWRMRPPTNDPDVVSVMVRGKPKYYRVHDKLLLKSILDMGPENINWPMRVFGFFRRVLTGGVVLDPVFGVWNFMRDSLASWVQTDNKFIPVAAGLRGAVRAWRENDDLLSIMAAGGGSGTYHRLKPGKVRRHFRRITRGAEGNIIDSPRKLLELVPRFNRALENANRLAVHEAVKKRGGTSAEAAFQAMDVLNFTSSPGWPAVRILTQSVPFMNARLQGLYRLKRGFDQNPQSFTGRGTVVAAATLALLLANWRDERYWELEEWERDTYYHFWIGEEHFRIPKPFEIGAIFSTIPERLFEAAFKKQGAGWDVLGEAILRMITGTFAINLPQLMRPAAEVAMNKDTFRWNPIVSRRMEYGAPEAQHHPWTSATFREVAKMMPDEAPDFLRSPVTLEHLWKGYTAALGMYIVDMSDLVVRNALDYPSTPETPIERIPVLGKMSRRLNPDADLKKTKYINEFYDLYKELGKLQRQMEHARELGEAERLRELQSENRRILATEPVIDRAYQALRDIHGKQRETMESRLFGSNEKRARLGELVRRENEVAREAVGAFKGF